jgi:hypothetical protein
MPDMEDLSSHSSHVQPLDTVHSPHYVISLVSHSRSGCIRKKYVPSRNSNAGFPVFSHGKTVNMRISSGEMSGYYQLYAPIYPEKTSQFNRRLSLTQIRYRALMLLPGIESRSQSA